MYSGCWGFQVLSIAYNDVIQLAGNRDWFQLRLLKIFEKTKKGVGDMTASEIAEKKKDLLENFTFEEVVDMYVRLLVNHECTEAYIRDLESASAVAAKKQPEADCKCCLENFRLSNAVDVLLEKYCILRNEALSKND